MPDNFSLDHQYYQRSSDLSFMDSRYPLERLLLLRATFEEVKDIYDGTWQLIQQELKWQQSAENINDANAIRQAKLPTPEILSFDEKKNIWLKNNTTINNLINDLNAKDKPFDHIDQRIRQPQQYVNSSYISLRKKWYGSGLIGGWLTARRFIAAWLPGKHSLTELSQQFKAWWLRTSLGRRIASEFNKKIKLPDQNSAIDTTKQTHPSVLRAQLWSHKDAKESEESQHTGIIVPSVKAYNAHLLNLLESCIQSLQNFQNLEYPKPNSQAPLANSIDEEQFIRCQRKNKKRLQYLQNIQRTVFHTFRQRAGNLFVQSYTLFLALMFFGITLIGLTLLAKLGILGVIAIKFTQLPIVALGWNYLTTFLINLHVYQYITQSPNIVIIVAASCFYIGAWLVKLAHQSISKAQLYHWLSNYALYARTLCNNALPLDKSTSIYRSQSHYQRRGICYLPGEHSKDGRDIPIFFMIIKTLLNPLRLVRIAIVIIQYILTWPLCRFINWRFKADETDTIDPKEEYTLLFLVGFIPTVGIIDLTADLILKPLEGLIYILDIPYDYILPTLGKLLMSPVILLYAIYSVCYAVKQGINYLKSPTTTSVPTDYQLLQGIDKESTESHSKTPSITYGSSPVSTYSPPPTMRPPQHQETQTTGTQPPSTSKQTTPHPTT